jgi:hypothetical protein
MATPGIPDAATPARMPAMAPAPMSMPVQPIPWPRFTAWAALAAAGYVLVLGAATAIVPTPWFDRILPVNGWNLASLILPALLFGPLVATYRVPWPTACSVSGRTGLGAGLSWFAASCPACNKIVVLAVGMSGARGAVRAWQPIIGLLSLALLALALRVRIKQRATHPARVPVPAQSIPAPDGR